MYSLVLMAALTTGGDVPDWGRHGGCYGCWGGCYGCRGGCWGCRGGCWGGWGGCYGCWGGYSSWGCWGGCYGGCFGGCYGGYVSGGWGGGWGGYVYAPTMATYSTPVLAANTLPGTTTNPVTTSMYYNPSTATNNRATIIVHVSPDAKLIVDGKTTTSTSETRRFYSPPLEAGQEYHYTFKAVVERDGKPASTTRRLDVRAGETYEISITVPRTEDATESKRPADKPDDRKALRSRSVRAN